MAKKVQLKDSSGNKCYPVTRDECILSGNKTLPERMSEFDISNNNKFNSIINYIKVYGNVTEKSKIELSFFVDKGSQLWVDGVSKGAYVYNEWAIDNLIEHTYNDVTIKFVPKAEAQNTDKAVLNNRMVLDVYKSDIDVLKKETSTLGTEVETLNNSINNIDISADKNFNSVFAYFEVKGNVSYSDKIEFDLYANKGSGLYINGVLKGAYVYNKWAIGVEQQHTYNDVTVVFMPIKEAYTSSKVKLNKNVLFGLKNEFNEVKSSLDAIKGNVPIISDNSSFNDLFNYVYVYGNIGYTDKIEWQIWADGGSLLTVNDVSKGTFSGLNSLWNIGGYILAKYQDIYVAFSPKENIKTTPKTQLNNKSVLGISSKLLKDISDLNNKIDNINGFNSQTLKFACFGDSITSNQVTNIGGQIKQKLGINFLQQTESDVEGAGNVTTEFGNLAVGWSTMTDVYLEDGGENQTPIYLLKSANVSPKENPYNVLSNQIRRLIAHTTPLGEQVSWTVQSDESTTTIPTEYGTGKGYTDDKPDIIYIASGINDTTAVGVRNLILKENFDEVIAQNYAELKRDTMYSALRWAIETLQNVYPKAIIFVATPLYSTFNSKEVLEKKCEIIKKMCDYMRVKVIDSNLRSGINPTNADTVYGGLHPNADGKDIVSSFVTGQIRGNCNIL